MARPTFVLCRQPSCKAYRFFAAPHDAPCGRCAGPHDASCDRCAAPHAARCDLCAALDAAPYRTMLEQTALELMVLGRAGLRRAGLYRSASLCSTASLPGTTLDDGLLRCAGGFRTAI